MSHQIDKIDLKILRIIQENNKISAQDIGDTVGLSASAVQRRITALKESGVILKDAAILSSKALGKDLTLIVEVALINESKKEISAFINRIEREPAVTQCYYVTGPMDYVIIYQASDMAQYDHFTQEVLFENPYVKTFNTKVVIRQIKSTHKVPI